MVTKKKHVWKLGDIVRDVMQNYYVYTGKRAKAANKTWRYHVVSLNIKECDSNGNWSYDSTWLHLDSTAEGFALYPCQGNIFEVITQMLGLGHKQT